jgi:hypothetical protein
MSATVIPTESSAEASGCAEVPAAARTATMNRRKRRAGRFAFTGIRVIPSAARDLLSSDGGRSFVASLLRMTGVGSSLAPSP